MSSSGRLGLPLFPQTLQSRTLVGRLAATAGPAEQIPFADIAPYLAGAGVATYGSVALLRLNTAALSLVFLSGYYAAGDGGSGLLLFVPSDTTSADDGGTIFVDASGHRYYRVGISSFVTAEMFGAKGDGSTDDSAALNAALTHPLRLLLSAKTYAIANTVRFQFSGQIIEGAGSGFQTQEGNTEVKWTGSSGGKMFSFRASSSGAENSNCSVRDLMFDGNLLAGVGIEVYDNSDSAGGGNWRNSLYNVAIQNVTQGSGIGIELGHSNSSPNFANDFFMVGGGIYNCETGAIGQGATENFYNATLLDNTTAAFSGLDGSMWNLHNVICVGNETDFLHHNIQLLSIAGGWYENSVNGSITPASGAANGNFSIAGAYLHTASSSYLINFGGVAGATSVTGCFCPGVSSSGLIYGINGGYAEAFTGNQGMVWGNTAPYISSAVNGLGDTVVGNSGNGQIISRSALGVANNASLAVPLLSNNDTFSGIAYVLNVDAASGATRTAGAYLVTYFQGDNTNAQLLGSLVNGSSAACAFNIGFSGDQFNVKNVGGVVSNIFVTLVGTLGA